MRAYVLHRARVVVACRRADPGIPAKRIAYQLGLSLHAVYRVLRAFEKSSTDCRRKTRANLQNCPMAF